MLKKGLILFSLLIVFNFAFGGEIAFPNDHPVVIHMGQNPSSGSHLIATDVPEVMFNTYYIY